MVVIKVGKRGYQFDVNKELLILPIVPVMEWGEKFSNWQLRPAFKRQPSTKGLYVAPQDSQKWMEIFLEQSFTTG
jgi:hypothetical protein